MAVSAIVVDNFYDDPDAIRKYALALEYYKPYTICSKPEVVPAWAHEWLTSTYRPAKECIFRSSQTLVKRLEDILGEEMDRESWDTDFPTHLIDHAPLYTQTPQNLTKLNEQVPQPKSAWWNSSFHLKYRKNVAGTFVHTHSLGFLHCTGPMGWAGVVYLTPDAPPETGLTIYRHRDPNATKIAGDHAKPDPSQWEVVDSYANIYNRLIIHRGNVPHSGGSGWDGPPEKARLIQTFFFKTKVNTRDGLKISGI